MDVTTLPSDPAERKAIPLARGLIDYFPAALSAVASLSAAANAQHHAGEPIHWDRSKSSDHDDCLMRHFLERGTIDTDGQRHSAKVAWRALAMLQEELERELGLPLPRNARGSEVLVDATGIGDTERRYVVGPVYSVRHNADGSVSAVLGTEHAA